VSRTEGSDGFAEVCRDVGRAVVTHDAFDASDAVPRKEGRGTLEEACTRSAFLVDKELGVRQPRPVVDCDVKKLPALESAETGVASISSYAMARLEEAAQLLRVHVHQFARLRPLVAIVGDRWLESAELSQTHCSDDPLSSRRGQLQYLGDL
jgi:hypothetical protein